MSNPTFFERYLAGEYECVWEELQSLGEILESSLRDDALAVARETMRRVCTNLKMIAHRLPKLGFEFEQPDQVFIPAQSNASQHLDLFEQRWGLLPFSVRAWYEFIHSVDLVASNPLSKSLIQSLDSKSVALSFSSSPNLSDDVSDNDELRWHMLGITFWSLEKSLEEITDAWEKLKYEWKQGTVNGWIREYYIERRIDPLVSPLSVDSLSVGMSASNCEAMEFKVGKALADCVLFDDGEETKFVDFLREKLLYGSLLSGHCSKNNVYNYLYIGKLPDHSVIASEVIKELIPF
ncbi:hypothetical protein [Calothrix sp. NIES-2098]|uniref:hypothetical protein n=1 Tax=Calothrix sp. NIES-2098 TaxID=1954171 RepID=UPI000B61DC1D|nr:hypothetical protein NIES2098_39970 [Calothrix sp. NIES-2098]